MKTNPKEYRTFGECEEIVKNTRNAQDIPSLRVLGVEEGGGGEVGNWGGVRRARETPPWTVAVKHQPDGNMCGIGISSQIIPELCAFLCVGCCFPPNCLRMSHYYFPHAPLPCPALCFCICATVLTLPFFLCISGTSLCFLDNVSNVFWVLSLLFCMMTCILRQAPDPPIPVWEQC